MTLHASEMATVWVLRAGDRDQLIPTFLSDGEVGVECHEFDDGATVDRASALRTLGVGLDDEPTRAQEARAALFLSFVRRIEVGDLAALIDPAAQGLVCGVFTGEYVFRQDLAPSRARHRRPVEWRRRLPFSDLPDRLERIPTQRTVLEDVADGRLRALLLACSREERGDDPMDRPAEARRPTRSAAFRTRAPSRPKGPTLGSRAERAERRCTVCLITKSVDLFDGEQTECRDCA